MFGSDALTWVSALIDIYAADQYYCKVPIGGPIASQMFVPGHFFWAPCPHLLKDNPSTELRAKYKPQTQDYELRLGKAGWDQFQEVREPVNDPVFQLRSKERALVIPAKVRLVIAISLSTEGLTSRALGQRLVQSPLVAPVFSFEGDDMKESYPIEFIERVKAYCYKEFFYLPPCNDPRTKEGFVRLDRIRPMHKKWLQHRGAALSDEVLSYFQIWLWHYLGADLELQSEVLFKYRQAKMQALVIAG